MQKLLITLIVFATLLSACSTHKLEIQQGNVVTKEMLSQLKEGMTTRQVKFIFGSPMLIDAFHPNRWDYLYTLKKDGEPLESRRLTLYFENDILTRIEQQSIDGKAQ